MNTPRTALNGVVRLTHLGIIRIEGEDAAKFIHGQLTQDFSLLGLNEARLAALCSPKGRMLASFIGFKRSPADILLVCSADLVAAMVKRLSMFVMRAKAKVSDASNTFAVWGLAGDATLNGSALATKAWACETTDTATRVNLYPADGQTRHMWVAPVDVPAPAGASLAPELWAWGEVRSGIATLSAPVSEAFVPQMLNYESVGGVSFKKGCYPGQEVVARSQFRGTLKRRAFLAHLGEAASVGEEVFALADPSQPVGMVVQCAKAPQGGFDAIVSLQLSAAAEGGLHVKNAAGPALELLPLPYPLLEDL